MTELLLGVTVFAAVASLGWAVTSMVGDAASRRLRSRLDALQDIADTETAVSAIRARYLRQLSPLERRLEQLPGMDRVYLLIEQAGWTVPAYRFVMTCFGLAAGGLVLALLFTRNPLVLLAALLPGVLPLLRARSAMAQRLAAFETQLPDALDLMARSLLAGNPLMESFKFVSEEMKPPIATEFGRGWSNVNYGLSLKASLADMLQRTPSVSLRSLATAILVQRETGGNLAEILGKITAVLRARAKFQRRLRTLTAEGRLSGWVLGGMPFAMAGLMSVVNPGYMALLFKEPMGHRMLTTSGILMVIGIFWIVRVTKVKV
ncbi:MAG TPA: type II secretion system F family protein [Verrucomicrobiae bacterium]|nr:type II secretion system F family protein [Verrucomicrobiae bacterium]